MTTTYPSRTVFTCDSCRKEQPPRVMEGIVKIKRAACDWSGVPVANGGQSFELCDECIIRLEQVIIDAVKDHKTS